MATMRYVFQESFDGFRRAKISSFISVSIICFLLILLGFFALVSLNVDRMVNMLNSRIDIQAFIANTLNDAEIDNVRARLLAVQGIESVEFESKEAAAAEFQKEFGQDIFDVLAENPLPSSFNVRLEEKMRTSEGIERIAASIEAISGIDEVIFNGQILFMLAKYGKIGKLFLAVLLIFSTLGALFIISNTTRLIILAKQQIINTMRLVGATKAFIRKPYLIEGMLQGTLAGFLAGGFLFVLQKLIQLQLPGLFLVDYRFYVVVILLGTLYGFLGSIIAIRRFLKF